MPIYEYACRQCGQVFSEWLRSSAAGSAVACPRCAGGDVTRLISAVAVLHSDAARLADFDPGAPRGDRYYRDPRNIGLWAQKQLQRHGVAPDAHFEEMVDKARSKGTLHDN